MKRMLAALALLGCSPPYAEMAASTSSSEDTSSTPGGTTTTTSGGTTDEASTTDDYVTTFSITHPPDLGRHAPECDAWLQDCPVGEKCMPWASDGGGVWDALRCFPVAPEPKEPGESCSVSGNGVSGMDDCVRGAMCWNVAPETGLGVCVAMCKGTEAHPICNEPCAQCYISAEAVLILCLPACDPLAQECGEGEACVAVSDAFTCAPDVSGATGVAGDACEFINVCDPGLTCASSENVPGCRGTGCCTPFCNLDAADDCDAQLPGSECTPWFESGEFPNTCYPTGTIGFCAVPQ